MVPPRLTALAALWLAAAPLAAQDFTPTGCGCTCPNGRMTGYSPPCDSAGCARACGVSRAPVGPSPEQLRRAAEERRRRAEEERRRLELKKRREAEERARRQREEDEKRRRFEEDKEEAYRSLKGVGDRPSFEPFRRAALCAAEPFLALAGRLGGDGEAFARELRADLEKTLDEAAEPCVEHLDSRDAHVVSLSRQLEESLKPSEHEAVLELQLTCGGEPGARVHVNYQAGEAGKAKAGQQLLKLGSSGRIEASEASASVLRCAR